MLNDPTLFAKANVLVVGDIMLDRYFWGKVDRISPEAPVPVVKKQKASQTLGGGGNVANNLAGLGCRVTVLGICGLDADAQTLRSLMAQNHIQDGLIEDADRPTTTKTRIMAQKQQVLRLDDEDVRPLSLSLERRLLEAFSKSISDYQVVILSDYGKGIFNTRTIAQDMIQLARQQNVVVLVDPKGNPMGALLAGHMYHAQYS